MVSSTEKQNHDVFNTTVLFINIFRVLTLGYILVVIAVVWIAATAAKGQLQVNEVTETFQ